MIALRISEAQTIVFVMVDLNGTEVTGLGSALTVELSKAGAAFAAGAGAKAEIGDGWYSYALTAAETNTAGLLAVKVTGAGCAQQNLIYQITGSIWETVEGPNILSVEEAAHVLRCDETDENMLMLLPQIDAYIEQATGRDWTADDPIDQRAKAVARMLLVRWHEDPGGMAAGDTLGPGVRAVLTQLEALALKLETSAIPDEELRLVGAYPRDGSDEVSVNVACTLIFNNEMSAGAVNEVSLTGVTTTRTLDATGKILTVTPSVALAGGTSYTLVLAAVTDTYGQTLTDEIRFTTED